MNAAVEAAWIAAGVGALGIAGTVTIAVVTAKITKRTNSETLEAAADNLKRALDAERDDKLWDKRARAYEEIITYLLYIQAKRRLFMRRQWVSYNKEYEEASDRRVGNGRPADWWDLQARLAAYGSQEAIAAFEASFAADTELGDAVSKLADIKREEDQAAISTAARYLEEIQAARDRIELAHKHADVTDESAVKLLRDELNQRPAVTPFRALGPTTSPSSRPSRT